MKRITLTEEEKIEILKGFAINLNNARMLDSISLSYTPKATKCPYDVTLDFDPLAWLKMYSLVDGFTTECAWHGVVDMSDDRHSFTVRDVLVYPQKVTGATVEANDVEYEKWHQALDNPTYNRLRFQAHSHVNFSVSPSGKDKEMYDAFLQTLGTQSYYIFMIINKKGDIWLNIYDLKENVIYEKSDIAITVGGLAVDKWGYETWFKEQKKVITAPTNNWADRQSENWNRTSKTAGQIGFVMPDHKPIHAEYTPTDPDSEYMDRSVGYGRAYNNPYFASDDPAVVNRALKQEKKQNKGTDAISNCVKDKYKTGGKH